MATHILDVEAQTTTATLASLPPAYTQTTSTPSSNGYTNAFDDFFGMSATRESRHDNRSSVEIPPPYPESLPVYSPHGEAEPATLAMYLFKFGFLFPPFWILGVVILLSPLSPPEASDSSSSWLSEKSDEERQFIISEMGRVEVTWARRCLWALLIFTSLAVGAGVAIWAVLRVRP